MSRSFAWGPGGPKQVRALALAALRPSAGAYGYRLTIGPCVDGSYIGEPPRPRTGVTVEVGLYHAPDDDLPIHSTLAGVASEAPEAHYTRAFFLQDLQAHVRALGGQTIYGAADGPGWRVVVPIRVVQDAQFENGRR